MNPEQILIGIIVGGVVGIQATLAAPQGRLGIMEGALFGILGAFFGSELLNVLKIFPNTEIVVVWLASLIGAVLLVALFATTKTRWYWSRVLRQQQNWSFIQPFEE